jgi:hypothetical protein
LCERSEEAVYAGSAATGSGALLTLILHVLLDGMLEGTVVYVKVHPTAGSLHVEAFSKLHSVGPAQYAAAPRRHDVAFA